MANQNLKISGQVSNEKIDNTALVEAIADMRKEFTHEAQNKVINTALRCTFLVPAVIEKNQELVADGDNHVQFQDKQTAKFLLINKPVKDENGNDKTLTYFPIFTSREELAKITTDQKYVPFAMKFSDVANLTENTPNVEGFVLDPFTREHNLPFTKPMLESIKQTLIKYRADREAAKAAEANGEAKPDITVSSTDEQ
ncbi:SseB family protein [Ruminococcus sp.]|uniref:SseB family protein n=1 Tax=Ruminococcus sp. TaxID=41978 RepID=UPI0025FA23FC|nr:SseB family protein [Ruminococcus sp.]MBQ8966818.1 SseB family protein [Ruminococcus sp.]